MVAWYWYYIGWIKYRFYQYKQITDTTMQTCIEDLAEFIDKFSSLLEGGENEVNTAWRYSWAKILQGRQQRCVCAPY